MYSGLLVLVKTIGQTRKIAEIYHHDKAKSTIKEKEPNMGQGN